MVSNKKEPQPLGGLRYVMLLFFPWPPAGVHCSLYAFLPYSPLAGITDKKCVSPHRFDGGIIIGNFYGFLRNRLGFRQFCWNLKIIRFLYYYIFILAKKNQSKLCILYVQLVWQDFLHLIFLFYQGYTILVNKIIDAGGLTSGVWNHSD